MATFSIPNNTGGIRQDNRGDNRGELWETFNCDLASTIGKIKVSEKLTRVLTEETDFVVTSTAYQPLTFEIYDGNVYAISTGPAKKADADDDLSNSANWATETGIAINGLGSESDATVFDGKLIISQETDMTSWDGTTDVLTYWTSTLSGTALQNNFPHILHTHKGGQETLFVTDKNTVRYYNTTAGHSAVTLQDDLVACCVASGVNAIWVGTYSSSGSSAYVYEIYIGETLDSTPVARNAYKVEGRAVLSIEVLDNVPYIVTEKGNLQAFNGAGFSTVASFPFVDTRDVLSNVDAGLVNAISYLRPVHPKGMKAYNNSIYININTAKTSGDFATRSPSGVWEYNRTTGQLTHRFSFTGAKECVRSGGLLIVDNQYTFLTAIAEIEDDAANGISVFATSDTANKGYFITKEIDSNTVQDSWEAAYLKAKTLATGESIKLKYRTTKRDPIFADGALATSTTLNSTTDLSDVAVGDEVIVTTGSNAGKVAHITAIQASGSTYSLTLDTSLGTAGDQVRVEITNFKLHPEEYLPADGEYKRFGIGETSPWIQYKVYMDGAVELRQFLAKSNSKTEV